MHTKSLLLILPLAAATGFSPLADALAETTDQTAPAITLTSEQETQIKNFLKAPYQIDSDVSLSYLPAEGLTVIDQVSSNARHSRTDIKGPDGTVEMVGQTAIAADKNGDAVNHYLGIGNDIESTNITMADIDGNYVNQPFEEYYGSPLAWMTESATDISSHFAVAAADSGYTLTADTYAIGKMNTRFVNFFPIHVSAVWDTNTYSEGINSLVIDIASDGTPTAMSFVLFNRDRFGIVTETYKCKLSAIDSVKDIEQYDSADYAEATALQSALDTLAAGLSGKNFTQTVYLENGSNNAEYHLYYDLEDTFNERTGHGLMLSDDTLTDASYGDTYMGIMAANSASDQYLIFACSPYADNIAQLDETVYTYEEVAPKFGNISPDFFTYDAEEKTYNFDLTDPRVSTSSFSIQILSSMFGLADGESARIPTYCSDMNSYAYDFRNLSIKLNDDGSFGSATLTFNSEMLGDNSTSTVSYSNFGNTDLSKVDAIKDQYQYVLKNGSGILE